MNSYPRFLEGGMKRIFTFVLALFAGGAAAIPCATDNVPAATLLIPYFEVDVGNCPLYDPATPAIRDTRFTIMNPDPDAVLTKVTIWSDWGIPLLDFEVYLDGWGEETISLGRVFCDGYLPQTGSALANEGDFSSTPATFPSCNATTNPANGSPVFSGDGSLSGAALTNLQLAATGQSVGGLCSAAGRSAGIAVGYVTVDNVSACSILNPTDFGYYLNIIESEDRLLGKFELFDPSNNSASAFTAVAIERADGNLFMPGDNTFYGRHAGGSTAGEREPLPTAYAADINGPVNPSQVDLLVWREVGPASNPVTCGTAPTWFPLDQSNTEGYRMARNFTIDRNGRGRDLFETNGPNVFPDSVQRVTLADAFTNVNLPSGGSVFLNLQHSQSVSGTGFGQAWVGVIHREAGRFETSSEARPLDDGCSISPFQFTADGPNAEPLPGPQP